MEHSFSIKLIRMNEAHFALNHQYKWEENRPIEFNYNLAVKYKQTDKVIGVIVSVSSDREEQPFRFSVTWEGLFVFDVVPSKDVLDRVAQINCASIIYPYLRESVTDLTRRASLPPLNLPPVNFVARYEEEHKPEAKKPSSQKTRRKSRE